MLEKKTDDAAQAAGHHDPAMLAAGLARIRGIGGRAVGTRDGVEAHADMEPPPGPAATAFTALQGVVQAAI
jgi:hypothetical protein